jgi:hypothetical protein
MVLDVLAWTDELEARRARPRVTRFVLAIYARLRKAGGAIIEQGETACCYAKSEKSWIDDPAGIAWETFHTTGENIDYGDGTGEREARVAHGKSCCAPEAAPASTTACGCST